jgi:TP901 family phage tail tape measure protein
MAGTVTVDELVYKLSVDDDASKGLDKFDKRLGKLKKSVSTTFAGVAGQFTGAITDAISKISGAFVDLGKDAVGNAIALQDAMNGVKRTAGLTVPEVQRMTEAVRDYSVNVLQGHGSSIQLAEALEIAGQQGIRGAENMLAFAGTIVKASVAFDGMNVGKVAEKLGLLHGTFTDVVPTIENAASVVNHFANTTKRGADFILTLTGNMAENAKLIGLSEGATIAFAAALGNVNQVASKSGTAMSKVFKDLLVNSNDWAEAVGIDAKKFHRAMREDAEAGLVMFAEAVNELTSTGTGTDKLLLALEDMKFKGDGVSKTIIGLGQNVDKLKQFLGEQAFEWERNTSAQEEFEGSTERVSAAWGSLQEVWGNTIGMVGDVLLPHIEVFLNEVKEIVIATREWLKASGFLTDVLPGVLREVNSVLLMMLDRVVEIAKNIDWSNVFKKVGDAIKWVWEKAKLLMEILFSDDMAAEIERWHSLMEAMKAITTVIIGVEKVLSALWDIAKIGLSAFTESLAYAIEQIKEMGSLWDVITGTIKIFANTAKNAIQGVILQVGTLISKLWDAAKAIAGVEEASHGESAFPDMYNWVLKDTQAMQGLTNQMRTAAMEASRLGQTVASVGAPSRPRGLGASTSTSTSSVSTISPGSLSSSSQPMQAPSSPATTVVFEGINVVDQSSLNNFVHTVTETQNDMWGHVVFGG